MKIKNNIFDKKVVDNFLNRLAIIELIFSIILIFIDIPQDYKLICGIAFFSVILILYLCMWKNSNNMHEINLNINNSKINIKYGDLFEQKGKKVIAFNEYFDTCVDDVIINKKV